MPGGDGSQSIRYVMSTRQRSPELPYGLVSVPNREGLDTVRERLDPLDSPIRRLLQSIRFNSGLETASPNQLSQLRAVRAGDQVPA